MVGCGSNLAWASRTTLCASGWHSCSAAEWTSRRGAATPTDDYWINDTLVWAGSSTACYAATIGTVPVTNTCPAGVWMKVVSGTTADTFGNTSVWANCGLDAVTPDEYLGGCNGDSGTAGALCCY
jgi:hypothetical protein